MAQFRAMHDLWAPDPAFADPSTRLRKGYPEFEAWWDRHDVVGGGAGRKTLHHPARGVLAYDYATFRTTADPVLKLTIYTPASDGS